MKEKFSLTKLLPFVFYTVLWQILSSVVNQPILFPSFFTVLEKFIIIIGSGEFFISSLRTSGGILIGFVYSLLLGTIFAYIASKSELLKSFLVPPLFIMKTVPVVSIIILLFMWLDNSKISTVVSFMMVFPIIFHNVYDGFKSEDKLLLQMAQVFKVNKIKKAIFISFPQIFPFLKAACKVGIGVAFKSGVAAEVITVPIKTIGESLYNSKIYFDSAYLLAWTAVLVLITALFEKLLLFLLDFILLKIEGGKN